MKTNKTSKNRDVPTAHEGQEYAKVVSMLGNNRVKAKFADGVERTCKIRGSMRRREWVHVGDIVLVSLRDLAGDKADILFAYQPHEVQKLKRKGEPVDIAGDREEEEMNEVVTFENTDEEPEGDHDSDVDWERV